MSNTTITLDDLRQFTGSETFYRHNLARDVRYTEGVQYLAEKAGAYWLVDKIATLQALPRVRKEPFQVWKLRVDGTAATLAADDGDDNQIHSERIDFTDFPLDAVDLWVEESVILLPSEH